MTYFLTIFLSLFIFSINAEEYIINFQGKRTTVDVHKYTDKDNFRMVLKIRDLSKDDREFVKKLRWHGEKTYTASLDKFTPEDQKLIQFATGVVKARKGKGKELKVSEPFASMRLKAGLSFTQFLHGNVDSLNQVSVTDRVTGSDAIGVYAKVEGVTDDKRSKAYAQINISDSGFKAYSFGLESNVYRMVSLGIDCTLYPNNSFIEFQDSRSDLTSKYTWYPGFRPVEGEGGGSLLISPYISVNF